MKLEVKNVKTFVGMEGTGFNATLYADGIKTALVIDSADGGEYNYQVLNKDKYAEVGKYIKTLPKIKCNFGTDDPEHMMDTDLDIIVSELVNNIEITKKLKSKMNKGIVIGQPIGAIIPDGYAYQTYNFKMPLSKIDKNHLQKCVNEIKAKLKDGNVILNTNLAELGVTV